MNLADDNLRPGCELWLLASSPTSTWTRKIDWLLNFQIMKADVHRSAAVPKELSSIASEWDVETPQMALAERSPLMISSSGLLPNSMTVVVPTDEIEAWTKSCARVWQDLKRPRARVFLPDGLTAETFKKFWRSAAGTPDEAAGGVGDLEVVDGWPAPAAGASL